MKQSCALCHAIINQASPTISVKPENTKLFESKHFTVMPCIGPFVPGHVLIVSREHFPNLASMGLDGIRDYENVALEVSKRWPFNIQGTLEAEHGSVDGEKAGACVTHTHVHLLPGLAQYVSMFDNILPVLATSNSLDVLAFEPRPYIFTRANLTSCKLYSATHLPSQMIRRTLCDELQRHDDNWKAFPRHDEIAHIIRQWELPSD